MKTSILTGVSSRNFDRLRSLILKEKVGTDNFQGTDGTIKKVHHSFDRIQVSPHKNNIEFVIGAT